MRLLQFEHFVESDRLDIKLCEYQADVPPYAIFSHRWGSNEDEVSFHDLKERRSDAQLKKGYKKVELCCKQALKDGLTHAWIDTCCIDKTSSAELSEAINSMYQWYEGSQVCYAYLSDAKGKEDMRESNWFTRAWTLQELIAPRKVVFFSSNWSEIGEKSHMAQLIYEITNVAENVSIHRNIEDVCIAQKMCWASKRQSTRIEDRAYSLLGLFNISLPILYGEGLRAFTRLQERILQTSVDHTIFAWDLSVSDHSGLLAESPDAFENSSKIQKMPAEDYMEKFNLPSPRIDYALTNHCLEIVLPHFAMHNYVSLFAAFLACYNEDSGKPIVIFLRRNLNHRLSDFFFRTKLSCHSLSDENLLQDHDKGKIALGKIMVKAPEKPWARAIRPLLPEEIAKPSNDSNELDSKGYNVRLMSSGTILAVYPMPHNLEKSEFTVDTDSGSVWVTSILLQENCEAKVVFAVIDDELVSHLILTNDLRTHSTLETFLSCEAYFKSEKLFPSELCKDIQLQRKDSEKSREEDLIVKVLDPRISYINTPKRKVFTFRVDMKSRKDWDDPNHINTSSIVQNDDERSIKWRLYVKAMADAPKDAMVQSNLDQLWRHWQHYHDYTLPFSGPKGSKQRIAYAKFMWEGSLKPNLMYLDDSAIAICGKLWRQLMDLKEKSDDTSDDEASLRNLENSKILIEHMKTTAGNVPNSRAIKVVYEEIWGMWKYENAVLDYPGGLTRQDRKDQLKAKLKSIRNSYSPKFGKKETERFQDFWRLLMDLKDFPHDTFGEGFTLDFRKQREEWASKPHGKEEMETYSTAILSKDGVFGPNLPSK